MQDIKPGAGSVHKAPQKSKTLNRQYTKRPVANNSQIKTNQGVKKTTARAAKAQTAKKSPGVSRFNKEPLLNKKVTLEPAKKPAKSSVRPATSTISNAKPTVKKPLTAKEQAIAQALKEAPTPTKSKRLRNRPKRKIYKINKKTLILISVITLLLIGTCYILIKIMLPNISLQMANNQAGIMAKYPEELPDGFKRAGYAELDNGAVTIKLLPAYEKASSKNAVLLKQRKTLWDATKLKASLENNSNKNLTTTEYKGLTIYHYDRNGKYYSTWINGEVLYSIQSYLDLDASQLRAIVDGLS